MQKFSETRKNRWMKFKIVVPTLRDKKDLVEALRHCHESNEIDLDYNPVNQLVHAYLEEGPKEEHIIIVDKELYETI